MPKPTPPVLKKSRGVVEVYPSKFDFLPYADLCIPLILRLPFFQGLGRRYGTLFLLKFPRKLYFRRLPLKP